MSVQGRFSAKFLTPIAETQGDIQILFELVFCAWPTLKIDLTVMPSGNLENNITWHFYDAIVAEKSRLTDDGTQQYCFSFLPGTEIIDGKGNRLGITDLQIQFGTDERNRFTIEAKLLNKQRTSNAGAYVGKEGMGRFISGQYGREVQWGGMMGYVLDGDTDKARKSVTDKIEKERQTLGMLKTETLKNSTIRKDVYETSHTRQTGTPLTIYHLFLPVVPHQN